MIGLLQAARFTDTCVKFSALEPVFELGTLKVNCELSYPFPFILILPLMHTQARNSLSRCGEYEAPRCRLPPAASRPPPAEKRSAVQSLARGIQGSEQVGGQT